LPAAQRPAPRERRPGGRWCRIGYGQDRSASRRNGRHGADPRPGAGLPPAPRAVRPAYLAITGLVQVLVLDALITKVEGGYAGYGATEWLVVAATFLVCVDIWHEYLMTVLSHVWLPGLLDSLVPFAFLVTELLMVHFVGEDLRGWLLGHGLVALMGVAAWTQRNLRIRQVADEERDLPLALATRHWYRARWPWR
jgi:hypothetical protein